MANDPRALNSIMDLPASFAVGFIILYLRSALTITTIFSVPDPVDRLMLLTGCFFLFLHCIVRCDSYKGRYFFATASLCIGLLCYVNSGESAPFVVILTVLAAATIDDIDDVVRLWLACTVGLVVFLAVLFAVEMAIDPQDSKIWVRLLEDGTVRQRFAFFFSHPNLFGAMVMMSCSAFVYLNQNWLGMVHYVLLVGIAGFVLFASDSRTSSLLIILLTAFSFIQKSRSVFDGRIIRKLVGVLPVAAFVAVFLVSGPLYNDSMSGMFTGRVSLWHACFVNQGVSLLGQEFVPSTSVDANGWVNYYTTLDSTYASGLYVLGVAFSLWFSWVVWKCATCEGYEPGRVLPALLTMLLFGITEVHVFSFSICYVLLLLGKPILGDACGKGGQK